MRDPHFQSERVTLYHGDCLTEHREWLDADVLVTDPPYGMSYGSNRVKGRKVERVAGDHDTAVRDTAIDAWGARPAIAFGRWNVERPAAVRARLIWSKGDEPGMGDLTFPWGNSDEEIYVLGNGFKGKRSANVLVHAKPPVNDRDAHPTPKPVSLMERLIEKCPPGTIADPFAGSGATLIAARNLGRKAVGVELEERYCEIVARRLAQGVLDFGDAA